MLLVYVLSSNKNEVTVDRVFVAFSILDWFTVSVSFIPVAIFFVTQVRESNVMGLLIISNAIDIMQCILIAICNYSAQTLYIMYRLNMLHMLNVFASSIFRVMCR